MAYKINDYVEIERTYFRGSIEKAVLVAVNPTQEELKALGLKADQEPAYVTNVAAKDINGNEFQAVNVRWDFYVKFPESKAPQKMTIFLQNSPDIRPSGAVATIDRFCNTHFFPTFTAYETQKQEGSMKWGDGKYLLYEGFRIARKGEIDFLKFCKEYFQIVDPTEWNNELKSYVDKTGDALAAAECDLSDEQWELMFKDFRQTSVYRDLKTLATKGQRGIRMLAGTKKTGDKYYTEILPLVKSSRRAATYKEKEIDNIVKGYKNTQVVDFVKSKNEAGEEVTQRVLKSVHKVTLAELRADETVEVSSDEEVATAISNNEDW